MNIIYNSLGTVVSDNAPSYKVNLTFSLYNYNGGGGGTYVLRSRYYNALPFVGSFSFKDLLSTANDEEITDIIAEKEVLTLTMRCTANITSPSPTEITLSITESWNGDKTTLTDLIQEKLDIIVNPLYKSISYWTTTSAAITLNKGVTTNAG